VSYYANGFPKRIDEGRERPFVAVGPTFPMGSPDNSTAHVSTTFFMSPDEADELANKLRIAARQARGETRTDEECSESA